MKFYFCETCGKRITEQEINEGLGRDKKLKGVYCNNCATGVSTLIMLPLTDAEARARLKAQQAPSNPDPAAEPSAKPVAPAEAAAAPAPVRPAARRQAPPVPEAPASNRNKTLLAATACLALLCAGLMAVLVQRSPEKKTPPTETKTATEKTAPAPVETKRNVPGPAVTPSQPPPPQPPRQPAPVPPAAAKTEEKTPDEPKPAVAETPAPASADVVAQIKQVLHGEVLKATNELYVEVRYDFVKDKDAHKDFQGPIGRSNAGGAEMKGFAHWEKEFGNSKVLRYEPLLQPKTLIVEYVLAPVGGHDIEIVRMGDAHIKLRWNGAGQLLTTYEPRFTGDVYKGERWNHPDPKGTYRYIVERAPGEVSLSIDDKPFAKQALPSQAQNEKFWFATFATNNDAIIKEVVVKGYLGPIWLKNQINTAKP